MKKARPLPAWTIRSGTESPAVTVSLEGHDVYVMTACKPHDCSSERIAVLYDPKKRAMCGVLSTVSPKASVERLTWLNVSNRDGSIDVRTILYAALTGSLENHPDAFDYK
ncbi:C-lysozyme inhibitor [Burkholderia multivorans]|nr:C-lysozyme inhibitor [Burkholderia multivorans]